MIAQEALKKKINMSDLPSRLVAVTINILNTVTVNQVLSVSRFREQLKTATCNLLYAQVH